MTRQPLRDVAPYLVEMKPALIRNADGTGNSIELELWSVPAGQYGSFVAKIPAPLGIGMIEIEDGRSVQGFVCTQSLTAEALDISGFGGWRNFVASQKR